MKKIIALMIIFCACGFIFAEKKFTAFAPEELEVSSFLTEGKTKFSKECLSPDYALPWVPAGGNNGKGQSITIKDCTAMDIYISIGYVSKDRPDLYEKNSRPKKVSVRFAETGREKVFCLKDTKEPQLLKIIESEEEFFVRPRNTLILTFPEVYEGTKYKDLCVNFIGVNNVFSGISFDYITECEDFIFNFGADIAECHEKDGAGSPIMEFFKEVFFKYAHNKELNRLYLVVDKAVFVGQNEILDKSSALSFIENAGMETLKTLEYTYNRQEYTREQWAEVQKSFMVRISNLFDFPVAYMLDVTPSSINTVCVTKYCDERFFSQLFFDKQVCIYLRDGYDMIYDSGFSNISDDIPKRNSDSEHFDANYVLMKEMNKHPDKGGYYSYVVGFKNPVVIKYKISGGSFDFVYPDGEKYHGKIQDSFITFRPQGELDWDYISKDAVWK